MIDLCKCSNAAIARFEKALLPLPFPLEALECLFLHACHLTSAQLTSVLYKTPHLQALCLRCLHNLDSFSYLAPVKHSLQCMQVLHSMNGKPSAVEMHRLLELKHLTSLTIRSSFTETLSADTLALFTTPSAALPELEECEYHPTNMDPHSQPRKGKEAMDLD